MVQFIKDYLLPQMTTDYINKRYFRGGDVLHRGTRVAIMDMIISVNDIDLVKLIASTCKHKINFKEKTSYFGGMAYGSSESSLLDILVNNKGKDTQIDPKIFLYK